MVFLHATPALSIRAFMVISPSIVRSASPGAPRGLFTDWSWLAIPHKGLVLINALQVSNSKCSFFRTVGRPSNGEENEEEKPQDNPQTVRPYDHSVNFSQYSTYSWGKVQTSNPFFVSRIQQAVDKQLQAKGWKLMPTGGSVTGIRHRQYS
jgi:hypothetical protein